MAATLRGCDDDGSCDAAEDADPEDHPDGHPDHHRRPGHHRDRHPTAEALQHLPVACRHHHQRVGGRRYGQGHRDEPDHRP